jgi:predicted nucleic acid-binding protein
VICVDASVATKWALTEEDRDLALDLYNTSREAGEPIIAPHFMPIEVTNAIWRRVVQGFIGLADAEERLRVFLEFQVELTAPRESYQAALALSDRFRRPAVYDMHYVALAQIAGCELWTADQRLLNALAGRLPFVKALAAYAQR